MEMIDISVIIPVYNSEKYIIKCLDSLRAQTMENIEIILINDGSTDRTEEQIVRYQREHSLKIRLFTRENAGQAAARNFGVRQARGKYIAFMDSDDYVEPEYLVRMYQTAEQYGSEVVTCGYRSVKTDGTVIRTTSVSPFAEVSDYGKTGVFVVWAKLFLREFIVRGGFTFPEGGKIYEDVPFSLETRFKGKNVKAIAYIGYNYVQHEASTMSSARVTGRRFPYDKMEEAIQNILADKEADRDRLEFEVLHFWAGFLFFFCRRAKREDIRQLSAFARQELENYFPRYWKNPYTGLRRGKDLPLLHRIAIRIFVQAARLHMLGAFTFLVTRL